MISQFTNFLGVTIPDTCAWQQDLQTQFHNWVVRFKTTSKEKGVKKLFV
jgi:hypothetical protein